MFNSLTSRVLLSATLLGMLFAAPPTLPTSHFPHREFALEKVQLAFEPAGAPSEFVARVPGLALHLRPAEAEFGHQGLHLVGANPAARAIAGNLLPGHSHYYSGSDRKTWRTSVPHYGLIRYQNAYPGIDVVYYGDWRKIEFDFIIQPGADPRRIQLALTEALHLGPSVAYQDTPSGRKQIDCRYERRRGNVIFELAAYDHTRPLVIDPTITYATLLGGGQADAGSAVAVDSSGAAYITGSTQSGTFPTVAAFQGGFKGVQDAFVAKISPDGKTLLYSTYFGGAQYDSGSAIAVDAAGNALVGGFTSSTNFPLLNATQPAFGGVQDAFAARFDSSGLLQYSTYLGGHLFDGATSIATDPAGNAYIAGFTSSMDFPTRNPVQSTNIGATVGFIVKLSPAGTTIYASYLGGSGPGFTYPYSIAVDGAGSAYVAGATSTLNYPVKNALQSVAGGASDAFLTKLSPDGSSLVYSTYLGGLGDDGARAVAVDAQGSAYIAGYTNSANFPTVNPLQAGRFSFSTTRTAAASWSSANAALPGGSRRMVVSPADPTNIYAITAGVLYQSVNSGADWSIILQDKLPILSFAVDPVTPTTLYAGGTRQLSKSTDRGKTWHATTYAGANVMVMAVDPKSTSTVYAGVGGGGVSDGLYKSTDGGENWAPAGITRGAGAIKALAIDPANSSILYLNSGNNLAKSTDGGVTLVQISAAFQPIILVVDPVDSTRIYSTDGLSVYKSTDAGENWRSTGLRLTDINSLIIDVQHPATLYAGGSHEGVFKTTDGFDHWNAVNTGLGGFVSTLAIDPNNGSTLYASIATAYDAFVSKLSADGQQLIYSTPVGGRGDAFALAIAVNSKGEAYVGGSAYSDDFPTRNAIQTVRQSDGGYVSHISADGSVLLDSTFTGGYVSSVALGADDSVFLGGTSYQAEFPVDLPLRQYRTHTAWHSENAGVDFAAGALPGLALSLTVDPKNPSRVFARTFEGLYRSTDGAQTWTRLEFFSQFYPSAVSAIVIDPETPSTIYVSGFASGVFGLFKSTDGGDTWTQIQRGFRTPPAVVIVSTLLIDPHNSNTLYASLAFTNAVYKTTDGGQNWAPTTGILPSQQAFILLAIDSQSTLYGTFFPGALYRSTDGGNSWTPVSNSPTTTTLAIDPQNPLILYSMGSTGISRSTDRGASWVNIYAARSIANPVVNGVTTPTFAFAIDPQTPSTLYLGSVEGGLLKSNNRGTTWQATGFAIPILRDIQVAITDSSRIYLATQANPSDAFVIKMAQSPLP